MKETLTLNPKKNNQSGQSFTEFTIVLAMMLSIVLTALLFISVFSQYGSQLMNLLGLETP